MLLYVYILYTQIPTSKNILVWQLYRSRFHRPICHLSVVPLHLCRPRRYAGPSYRGRYAWPRLFPATSVSYSTAAKSTRVFNTCPRSQRTATAGASITYVVPALASIVSGDPRQHPAVQLFVTVRNVNAQRQRL